MKPLKDLPEIKRLSEKFDNYERIEKCSRRMDIFQTVFNLKDVLTLKWKVWVDDRRFLNDLKLLVRQDKPIPKADKVRANKIYKSWKV